MEQKKIEILMEEVIKELVNIGLPVSKKIKEIKINRRAKSRFGCCKIKKGNEFVIELSAAVLSCEDKKIKEVIAHEILHTCPGCQNHQYLWKCYAERANQAYGYHIQRVSSYESMGIGNELVKKEGTYKYILKCKNCQCQIHRKRKSKCVIHPELYRCGKCGGALYLKENPPISSR